MKALEQTGLDDLLAGLTTRGYRLVGPTVADGAIVYDEIHSSTDLPVGWTDEQEAGRYRLSRRDDDAHFGFAVGPQSWKRLLHPPSVTLFRARRNGEAELELVDDTEEPEPTAFVGVRSCDLHAIGKLDRVFLGGRFVNVEYERRRGNVFIVAVNCGVPANTCFCVSMGTGPRASSGYDVALTEVVEDGRRWYLAEAGTDAGAALLAELPGRDATSDEVAQGDGVVEHAAASMGRSLETEGLPEILKASREHPHWDEVAERCLSCGNCTMVCPTCFCTTVEDVTDLTGAEAERRQVWDSCYSLDFTYLHGGSVRTSTKARYRHWLTHKLGTWHDQFGESGCVGCGRCIAWCPVGIDITQEAAALREEAP